jgi:RNA polymerase sigma-70 factor (ECF subfamily)
MPRAATGQTEVKPEAPRALPVTGAPEEGPREARAREEDDLRSARAGDRAAFDRLVLSCQDDVVSAASYFLGSYDDAVDAAQEAFLKAYRGLAGFRGGASFKTWVIRIALNAARSLRTRARARKRGGGQVVSMDGLAAGKVADAGSPIEVADPRDGARPAALLERRELKEAIERAIVELDPEAREVIVLRDLSGQSYEEIAAALGLPLGTVKSRVHRARLELQAKLRPWL